MYLNCNILQTFSRCTFAYEWPIVTLNILGRASSIGTLALCYVYSAEVFPTVVRNVGIGSSSVWVSSFVLLVYASEIICPKEIDNANHKSEHY